MRNYIATGDVLDVTLAADATAGDVVVTGDSIAVAATDGLSGATIACDREGVFSLPKSTAGSSASGMGQGKQVYWDATAKHIVATSNSGANNKAGIVYSAPVDADATVKVCLNENAL